MSWHADGRTLERYAEGHIDEAGAFSLEAHLMACARCRTALGGIVGHGRLDHMWADIVDWVDRPRARPLEWLLTRVGIPGHVARLLAATPALRGSWVLTVAAVLGFAVLAARAAGDGLLPFLVVAPLAPVVGVALAYGPATDPLHEVGLASPAGGFRLLLMRTAAVLVASLTVAGVAALGLPHLGWTAAGWLLPSLSLTVLTLALSTVAKSTQAVAAGVTAAWIVSVIAAERLATERYAAFGPGAQLALGVMGVLAVVVLVARRGTFETTAGGRR